MHMGSIGDKVRHLNRRIIKYERIGVSDEDLKYNTIFAGTNANTA